MSSKKTKRKSGRFKLKVSGSEHDLAYLYLPSYSGEGCKASKTVQLRDLMGAYKGPDVILDFDQEGVLFGIEILV